MNRRGLGLLLAGAAAFGYYKYSRMTPAQKADLRNRGKGFLDKQFGGLKNIFGRKTAPTGVTSHSPYTPVTPL